MMMSERTTVHTRPTTQLHNCVQHRSGEQCRQMNTTSTAAQHRSGEQVGHTKTLDTAIDTLEKRFVCHGG